MLVGTNLGGDGLPAVSHWCRFGQVVVRGTAQPEPQVVDNAWEEHTVRCIVPQLESGRSVHLSVSLNGQQFTSEDVRFSVARARGLYSK